MIGVCWAGLYRAMNPDTFLVLRESGGFSVLNTEHVSVSCMLE